MDTVGELLKSAVAPKQEATPTVAEATPQVDPTTAKLIEFDQRQQLDGLTKPQVVQRATELLQEVEQNIIDQKAAEIERQEQAESERKQIIKDYNKIPAEEHTGIVELAKKRFFENAEPGQCLPDYLTRHHPEVADYLWTREPKLMTDTTQIFRPTSSFAPDHTMVTREVVGDSLTLTSHVRT